MKNRELYDEPRGNKPPPWWIRGLLVLTCSGVSFAHGSNDHITQFVAVAQVTQASLAKNSAAAAPADVRKALSEYVRTKTLAPDVVSALAAITGRSARRSRSTARVPAEAVANVRNDMYLASEAIRFLEKDNAVGFDADTKTNLKAFKSEIDGQKGMGLIMLILVGTVPMAYALNRAMPVVFIMIGVAIFTGADKRVEAWAVEHSPDWLTRLTTRY